MRRLAIIALLALSCGPSGKTPTNPAPVAPADAGPDSPNASEDIAATNDPAPWDRSGVDWSKPPEPTAEPSFAPPVAHRFALDNGLKVIVIENHKLPLVTVQLVNPYGGSVYDARGKYGLASLTADLMDEGAGDRDALELADQAERLGARIWVSAGDDSASAGMSGLARTLDSSLVLLADVVTRPALAEADFARIKSDRIDALKQQRDQPRAVASLAFYQTLYGADGVYGWPTRGRLDTVAKLKRRDVQRFYAKHWRPNGATLLVAGDVTVKTLRPKLEASFGQWAAAPLPKTKPRIKPIAKPARLVMVHTKDAAPQSVVRIGKVGLTRNDPRYHDAEVLNTALGGSFTSLLNNRLREQLGYTYGAGSGFDYGRERGAWMARTDLVADKTIPGIKETLAIIASVTAAPLPDDELGRARALLVRAFPQMFQSNGAVVSAYGELALFGLPDDWFAGYVEAVSAVDAASIHKFALDVLAPDTLVLVVAGDINAQRDALLGLGIRPAVELNRDGKLVKKYK